QEGASLPRLALHPDPPAVGVHGQTSERETEPGTTDAWHARRPQRLELPEDHLLVLGSYPRTVVADADQDVVVDAAGGDADLHRPAGVHDGILHQVRQYPRQQPTIGLERRAVRRDVER